MSEPLITLTDVEKRFASGVLALNGVSLQVAPGELLSLVGPSGCGKSTVLRLVAGLDQATRGAVDAPALRNRAGGGDTAFVFQEATLMPWASVFDNVWLPLRLAGASRHQAAERINTQLAAVGLGEFAQAYPGELSGGMKMRASIARALVTRPRLLLMDEPFAALDEFTRQKLNGDLLDWWQQQRLALIFVTHSVFEAVFLSQRVVVMGARPGRVLPTSRSKSPTHGTMPSAPPPAMRRHAVRSAARWPRRTPGGSGAMTDTVAAPRNPAGPSWAARLTPVLSIACALIAWELTVRAAGIPSYTLPAPSLVATTLVTHFGSLAGSWWFTLKITFGALALACLGGVGIAAAFALSRRLEAALFPLAVVLQVTPIVAVAPLILIYVESTTAALLLCAWIVAFFPILSNTVLGLRAADTQLRELFMLYRATPWQRLRLLLVPSALPYFVAGLKISGGLSLIGAVTAEMVAGAAGRETGLASRILEASFRTETPKMFAALSLLVATGVMIFWGFNALSRRLLGRWHASESRGSFDP